MTNPFPSAGVEKREPLTCREIELKLRALIREQSEGEWDEDMIRKDADVFTKALWPLITKGATHG